MTKERASNKKNLKAFLALFPPVEMPLTLGEETHHLFSKENKPLPEQLIHEFILPHEGDEVDEFTEFVPCFSFQPNPKVLAIVYWRATLLHYAYIMLTYTTDGKQVSRSIIAQSGMGDTGIRYSAVTIREDFVVYAAEGEAKKELKLDAVKQYNLEILTTGDIIAYNAEMN